MLASRLLIDFFLLNTIQNIYFSLNTMPLNIHLKLAHDSLLMLVLFSQTRPGGKSLLLLAGVSTC